MCTLRALLVVVAAVRVHSTQFGARASSRSPSSFQGNGLSVGGEKVDILPASSEGLGFELPFFVQQAPPGGLTVPAPLPVANIPPPIVPAIAVAAPAPGAYVPVANLPPITLAGYGESGGSSQKCEGGNCPGAPAGAPGSAPMPAGKVAGYNAEPCNVTVDKTVLNPESARFHDAIVGPGADGPRPFPGGPHVRPMKSHDCPTDHCDAVCNKIVSAEFSQALADCKKTCKGMTNKCCDFCLYSSFWSPTSELNDADPSSAAPSATCLQSCPVTVVQQLTSSPFPLPDLPPPPSPGAAAPVSVAVIPGPSPAPVFQTVAAPPPGLVAAPAPGLVAAPAPTPSMVLAPGVAVTVREQITGVNPDGFKKVLTPGLTGVVYQTSVDGSVIVDWLSASSSTSMTTSPTTRFRQSVLKSDVTKLEITPAVPSPASPPVPPPSQGAMPLVPLMPMPPSPSLLTPVPAPAPSPEGFIQPGEMIVVFEEFFGETPGGPTRQLPVGLSGVLRWYDEMGNAYADFFVSGSSGPTFRQKIYKSQLRNMMTAAARPSVPAPVPFPAPTPGISAIPTPAAPAPGISWAPFGGFAPPSMPLPQTPPAGLTPAVATPFGPRIIPLPSPAPMPVPAPAPVTIPPPVFIPTEAPPYPAPDCGMCSGASYPRECQRFCSGVYHDCAINCMTLWGPDAGLKQRKDCYKRCGTRTKEVMTKLMRRGSFMSPAAPGPALPADPNRPPDVVGMRNFPVPKKVPRVPCPEHPPPRPLPQLLKAVLGVYPGFAAAVSGLMGPSPAPAPSQEPEPITQRFLGPAPAAPSPAPVVPELQAQRFLIEVESTGNKLLPFHATDFEEFVFALKSSGLPRIGLVALDPPQAVAGAPAGASFFQQPGIPNGRRIVLVLWIKDDHPLGLKQLYSAGFTSLRRLTPDHVSAMVARTDADLSFDMVFNAGRRDAFGWTRQPVLPMFYPAPAPVPVLYPAPAPSGPAGLPAPAPYPQYALSPAVPSGLVMPPAPAPAPTPAPTPEDMEKDEENDDDEGEEPAAEKNKKEKEKPEEEAEDEDEKAEEEGSPADEQDQEERKQSRKKKKSLLLLQKQMSVSELEIAVPVLPLPTEVYPSPAAMATARNLIFNHAYGWVIFGIVQLPAANVSAPGPAPTPAATPFPGPAPSPFAAPAPPGSPPAPAAVVESLAAPPAAGPGVHDARKAKLAAGLLPGPAPAPAGAPAAPAPAPAGSPGAPPAGAPGSAQGAAPGSAPGSAPGAAPGPAGPAAAAAAAAKATAKAKESAASAPGAAANNASAPAAAPAAAASQAAAATAAGTTTAAPGAATTSLPAGATTAAPGATTAAPGATTVAAAGGTTAAPASGATTAIPGQVVGGTTAAPGAATGGTTASPGGSTAPAVVGGTTAVPVGPGASTAAPAATTAPPGATTAAPGAEATTAAPGATTPAAKNTAETTPAPGGAAAGGTTVPPAAAAGGTTAAPGGGADAAATTAQPGAQAGEAGGTTVPPGAAGSGVTAAPEAAAAAAATTTITTTTITTTTTTTTTRPDFGAINALPTVPPSGGMPTSTTTTTTPNCVVGEKIPVNCQEYKYCVAKNGTFSNFSCAAGTAFDMDKQVCTDPTTVTGCEDYAPDCETLNTGGTCVAAYGVSSNCAEWRGDTECINGICHCQAGWCAIPEDSPGSRAGACIYGLEAHEPTLKAGSSECFSTKTEAKCSKTSDCEAWRGPTECKDGVCVCREDLGLCSSKDGRCLHNPKAVHNFLFLF